MTIPTLDYQPPADHAKPRRLQIAYLAPFAVFMLFTFAGGQWPQFYPLSYVLKTFVVAVLLICFWRYYSTIRWTHLWLGALVGIVGVVQWIGIEKLFMHYDSLFRWTRISGDAKSVIEGAFRPLDHFESPLLAWSFIAVRLLGASLLVPVMEELFWRDYLWRSIASPNDFRLHQVGEYDPQAFWFVPIAFATVHPQWLTAIVWGLLIACLLVKTRSLGACIVAHGVTNLLLGLYVLKTGEWFFW